MLGTYGHAYGNNWTSQGLSRPDILERDFYESDVRNYQGKLNGQVKVMDTAGMTESEFGRHVRSVNQHVILGIAGGVMTRR
ncbi:hypothetical protein FIV31_06320 [Coxiella endosymbiont of Ornithodoros amblus]|uniref:hypothetical protein n=1 Tax=Coxiella endosymbiont of Ornithodoros amblus TaxID=1656166 RepID=UPI003CC77797|nr:hypothetical protein [Coxiella endosymbiont of Ornithodoros amblus]